MHHLSEQELVRRENLHKLTEAGIEAYPSATFEINTSALEIKSNFKEGDTTYQSVSLAGRLMSKRIMGKASFAELQDSSGRIQIYINRDEICPGKTKFFIMMHLKNGLILEILLESKVLLFTLKWRMYRACN
jgi:lysyl-tRNA synthetase class 2